MKFAISMAAVPEWDLGELAGRARELGYDGVELHGPTGDRAAVIAALARSDMKIACVSAPVGFAGDRNQDVMAAGLVEAAVELARETGCPLVRIDDAAGKRGATPEMLCATYGEFLRPLADFAAERGVSLLVENGPTFRRARDVWTLLDVLQHPGVAACWDVLVGRLAGETLHVSVPTLNQRIRHVHLGDARIAGGSATPVQLGDGDVDIKALLARLKGIGYAGFLSLNRIAGDDPGAYFAEAIKRLRDWTKPPPEAKPKLPPKPAAAAPKPPSPKASGATPANAAVPAA